MNPFSKSDKTKEKASKPFLTTFQCYARLRGLPGHVKESGELVLGSVACPTRIKQKQTGIGAPLVPVCLYLEIH